MIDDSKRMCLDASNHGITTFIMDTPYNKDVDGLIRVHTWKEIFEKVKKYNNRINVILDTDTYNEADDQFALSYLLKSQDMFNIEAITTAPYSHKNNGITVKEEQDLSYNEVLKICNLLNFNFENKVFKGDIIFKGHIYLGVVIIYCLKFYFNENNKGLQNILQPFIIKSL